MIEVKLTFSKDHKEVLLWANDSEGENHIIPIEVTHRIPLTGKPVLGIAPEGFMTQSLLDILFEQRLEEDEQWWFEYFVARRKDQGLYEEEIALNDISFKAEVDNGKTLDLR